MNTCETTLTDPARVAEPPMHLSLRSVGIILVVLIGWSTSSRAQSAPTLSPPVAQGSTDVPYPPDAQGDAFVVLELVVDIDGSVVRALVKEGAEPFAEQALRAVLTWRFVPARRGSSPVAARIRARVEFHQEEAAATSSATDAATPAPSAPAAATVTTEEAEAVEVTVRGAKHEIRQTTLSATDFREMPGAFGDPFRAIEALPGVTPVVSGLPFFYIRGAPPNDNAYFVHGIRVPLLFHVGIAQG